jgi:tRNA A37 threonylcarbamoyladenosine dehydratase
MSRFARTELLLGESAMEQLREATVVVCGLGAVGSYATEALARCGVGTLRLVDFDVVAESNINRQLYALDTTVGCQKTDVAAERVGLINPDCRVEAMSTFIEQETLPDVMRGSPDIVVDAIDGLNSKVSLLRYAVDNGHVAISSMGAASRTDPSAIRVDDISKTAHCPLARLMRKRLRRQGVVSGIRCVYSTEPARKVEAAVEEKTRGRPRAPLGSLSFLTGMFGLVVARETVATLLGWDVDDSGPGDGVGHAIR